MVYRDPFYDDFSCRIPQVLRIVATKQGTKTAEYADWVRGFSGEEQGCNFHLSVDDFLLCRSKYRKKREEYGEPYWRTLENFAWKSAWKDLRENFLNREGLMLVYTIEILG
ncbi:unnamed protein product [Linum trigynum]|uniref:Uncharacterized protein n=1 Tax=Linum trigynum TaxID=586398 RepID=A0AAV2CKJ5_9ROSI